MALLNKSIKKKYVKTKRNKSARKRLLTVNKLNGEKLGRNNTSNSTYKQDNTDRSTQGTPLFPPIAKVTKCQSSNSSKASFCSNFASDIKQKANKEFVFKHSKAASKPLFQAKHLTDFSAECSNLAASNLSYKQNIIKRLSDPIELTRKDYLRNFNFTTKNA